MIGNTGGKPCCITIAEMTTNPCEAPLCVPLPCVPSLGTQPQPGDTQTNECHIQCKLTNTIFYTMNGTSKNQHITWSSGSIGDGYVCTCEHSTLITYTLITHKQLVSEPTYAYGSTHIWCNLCDMVCHLCPLSFVILPPLPPLASSLVYPSQCLSANLVYACLLSVACGCFCRMGERETL